MGAVRRAVGGLACGLLLAACTGSAPSASPDPSTSDPTGSRPTVATTSMGWTQVPAPQRGARVRVIEPLGDELLALGSVPGHAIQGSSDRAPGAWLTADLHTWRRIPLRPTTGYGELAEFVRGGVYRGHVVAFGNATGGAHGNSRPTMWTGDRSGMVEHVQSFILFGGLAAISQNGETVGAGGALIVGQWEGRTGYGATVWTSPDGAEWVRHQDAPGLAPARGEQTTARGAAPLGRHFLVVGDVQTASGATHALAWTSSDPRRWHRVELPARDGATAARASCTATSCAVLGSRVSGDPRLMCWTIRADGSRARLGPLGPSAPLLEPEQLTDTGAALYSVVGTDRDARLVAVDRDCSRWRTVPLPAASPDAAVGVLGSRMLLATTSRTSSRLWVRTLP